MLLPSWLVRPLLASFRERPWIIALGVALACSPTATAPRVEPSGQLTLANESAGGRNDGPFRVVFAGPSGVAESGAQISIVFSRPLVPLELADDPPVPQGITIEPPLPGEFRWVGTSALLFAPAAGELPDATRIRVSLAADLRALDGATLGQPFSFEFETPRPQLVRSMPLDGQTDLPPDTTFELRFNQVIPLDELRRNLDLTATVGDQGRRLSFSLDLPQPKQPKLVRLKPSAPLPADTKLDLSLKKGTRGSEGPLGSEDWTPFLFETYRKLTVTSLECSRDDPKSRCRPGGGAWLRLSNPVKMRDLKQAIQVTPAVPLTWESWYEDEDLTSSVDLNAAFAAGETYTVTVAAGLRDTYGQTLSTQFSAQLAIGDYAPRVEIGVEGDYFEPAARAAIPVGSINVPEYSLWAAPLSLKQIVDYHERQGDNAAQAFDVLVVAAANSLQKVKPTSPKNRPFEKTVDPATALQATGGRGALLIATRHSGKENPREHRIVQVTDLALSAKLSRSGNSVVWVTELGSGKPVVSAEVRVVGKGRPVDAAAVRTDNEGIAVLPPGSLGPKPEEEGEGLLVVVKKGEDWAYRRVSDYLPPWRSAVHHEPLSTPRSYGLLFTERGLYRPGDTVELKGFLRREAETGNDLLVNRAFTVELQSPNGELLESFSIKTNAFGSFAASRRIPASAPLGTFRFGIKELANEGDVATSFEVAEYKPQEMKATVSSDKTSYFQGAKARFTVAGDYLFGSPMANAPLEVRVTRAQTTWPLPGDQDWVSDASIYDAAHPEKSPQAYMVHSGVGKLNAEGRFDLNVVLDLPGQRGPELVSVDAEVTDVSRQTVGAGTSAVVHPADFYVGLASLEDSFVAAGKEIRPRVAAMTPDGHKLGGKHIRLDLIRRRWTLVRETTGGSSHAEMRPLEEVVASCTMASSTAAAAPLGCPLQAKESGSHFVLATARDDKGRETRAAQELYVIGAGVGFWQDDDAQRLELSANKKQYRSGETARVLIKSPFAQADALVTVEASGVRQQRRVTLTGATPTIDIPVTEQMRPGAYVSVHLIRPRTQLPVAGQTDVGAPTYRAGHVQLVVDAEAQRLQVGLRPNKSELSPGEEVQVDLTVLDAQGKGVSAEVTVYAVDEGVLSLIGYRTPDPLPVFTAPRPLRTATLESRESLARLALDSERLLGLGPNKGADGGGGGEGSNARRDFRQSAYFNPAVMTDANGKAQVRFKLPDSLTTYRLMAVAVSKNDRYGYAEKRLVSSKNLMARPALPRFFRAGDRVSAGVIVSGKNFGPSPVQVALQADGVVVEGPSTQTVQLTKDGSTEARFTITSPRVGNATFQFAISAPYQGKTWKDAVLVKRAVQSPADLETVALYGETASASAQRLGDLAAIRRDVGGLNLSVSSSAMVGLGGGFEQLLEYPYGCTEQLVSSLLPLLALRDLARSHGLALPQNPEKVIEETLANILSRQRGDGGFAMWPETTESSLWVSPYALWTLHEAKKRKFSVSQSSLDTGRDYLRKRLAEDPDRLAVMSHSFELDVLAMLGEPDAGYMNALFQKRAQLPAFAQAFLLHAMAISKQPAADIATLSRELENRIKVEGPRAVFVENTGDEYAPLMDSPLRTTALILRGLLAARPNHPLASLLVRGLLDGRQRGAWGSTQETAFALLALDAYRAAQEKAIPKFETRVWQGEALLFQAALNQSTKNATERVPAANLKSAPLIFEKDGSGTLFFEARLSYARKDPPQQLLDRGFFIKKTMREVTASELGEGVGSIPKVGKTEFAAGALVLVDLVLVTPTPRHYVVLDDPLPAGLEAINSEFMTIAAWNRLPDEDGTSQPDVQEDGRAHGDGFQSSSYRKELRDDRVAFFVDRLPAGIYHYRYLARATTLGSFVAPPTRAQEMYSPEVFGRTGAQKVQIK